MAEKLVEQAGERGIPYAIYRPGLVSGHSLTGAWNTDNLISSMTRACVLLGSVPDLDVMVNIVPVDFVSAAIIHLSRNPENLGKIYHLDNPEPIHFSKLADWLANQGFNARKVSFDEWRAELFRQVPHMPSDGWEPYLPLLEEVEEKQVFMPEFDLSNTLCRTEWQRHPLSSGERRIVLHLFEIFHPARFLTEIRDENKVNPSPWFVCPRADSNAETRLFLFPYAGGGPAVFGKWPAELSSNMEAWIAHYPGRGSRHNESPIKELDDLVGKLSQAIQPLLDKPFAFFGHSMGGLVAFELARHLRKNDLPQPITLFVSGCGAPHLPDPHPTIHTLPDAEFLNALRQFNGIPPELLRLPDAMELLLPTLRADFEAVESYVYNSNEPPLDCPIIAFGGLDDPRVSRERSKAGQCKPIPGLNRFTFPAIISSSILPKIKSCAQSLRK